MLSTKLVTSTAAGELPSYVVLQPVAYSIAQAAEVSSISKKKIYEAINAGELIAHYHNKRRVILHIDLVAYIQNLPLQSDIAENDVSRMNQARKEKRSQ